MLKKPTLLAGLLVLMAMPLQSFAHNGQGIRRDGPPPTAAKKQSSSIPPIDSVSLQGLLADGVSLREKMANRSASDFDRMVQEEALEYPAIDLYGEDSWGRFVNPFAGRSVDIPAEYDIDCSGFVMPLDGDIRVTSSYGYRRRFRRNHRGIDLGLRTGDTIRAAFDGKVRIRDYEGKGYGYYVVLRHPNGFETVYGHMSRQLVEQDQIVRAGDPIGLGGSTGRSTGPHLHLEFRFMGVDINPAHIIDFESGQPLRDSYAFRHAGGKSQLTISSEGKAYAGAATGVRTPKAKARKAPRTYRVRQGDSPWSIADKHKVSVTELCKLNNMSKKAALRVGQTLRLP